MTGRDPDEPDRPPNGTDVDAAFAEIVAGWEREPQWPTGTDGREAVLDEPPPDAEATDEQTTDELADDERADTEDGIDDDDHFVPPEPPPLPRPQPQTVGAIALFVIGLVLLVIPNMLGFSARAGLILGLLAISGGIVWLIARLRQGPPTDSGWDDGAQL
jgi:hypothetical protein